MGSADSNTDQESAILSINTKTLKNSEVKQAGF